MNWASSLQVLGDLAISITFPLLIVRILTRGNAGVSATSQFLHFVSFALRYFEVLLDHPQESTVSELAWFKVYMVIASISVLVVMRYHKSPPGYTASREQRLVSILKESSIYLVLSILLAYRINYASFSWSESWSSHTSGFNWITLISDYFSAHDLLGLNTRDGIKVAWAASIFLVAVADIPQYVTYYRATSQRIDRFLMTIMAVASLSATFYAMGSIARIRDGHSFNYIAFTGALVQVFAFWMFFVLVMTKVNDCNSDLLDDLEAQMEEYDTERWGGEARDPYAIVEEPREDGK